jgi:hypothetical protein
MSKSITSITAALFVLGAALQAGAEQGKSTQVTRSNISNNKAAAPTECVATADGGDCDDAAVKSPRDAASGQATGKRQHTPIRTTTADVDGDGAAEVSSHEVKSPRDAASGLATGKRSATGDVTGDGAAETQDHNSSRSNKSGIAADDGGGAGGSPEAQGMAINEKGLPGGSTKAKAGKTGSAK